MNLNIKLRRKISYLLLPVMILFSFQTVFAYSRGQSYSRVPSPDSPNTLTINNSPLTINTNPFKFSSYYFDSGSGLYYLNARYYSPELMRFINRDTFDLSNRYAYCNGQPVSQIDPTGHMAKWLGALIAGIGTVIGIALSIPSGGCSSVAVGMWIGTTLLDCATAGTTIASYYTTGTTQRKLAAASLALGIVAGVAGIASGALNAWRAPGAARAITENRYVELTEAATETVEERPAECAICYETINDGEASKIDPATGCTHGGQFHGPCLKEWLRNNTTCPLCRAEIRKESISCGRVLFTSYAACNTIGVIVFFGWTFYNVFDGKASEQN